VPGYLLRRDWHAKRVWHVEHVDRHDEHHPALCLNDRSSWQHDGHRDPYYYAHHGRPRQHHGQGEEKHHHHHD
jgi:hypothetical protein